MKLIPITPPKTKLGRRNRCLASHSRGMGFPYDATRLPACRYTAENHFKDKVLIESVRNTRRFTKIFRFERFHEAFFCVYNFADRHDNSSSPCACHSLNRGRLNFTMHRFASRCIRLCTGYLPQVVEQRRCKEGYRLCEQWL